LEANLSSGDRPGIQPAEHPKMKLEFWSDSNIGLIRKSNQDAVGCFPEISLFVVADGMGGRAEGEIASRMAVEVIHESLARDSGTGRAATGAGPDQTRGGFWRSLFGGRPAAGGKVQRVNGLRAAVELANLKIFEAGRRQNQETNQPPMGTTVVALAFTLEEPSVHWAYVGDSRLYRVRNRDLVLLTADHTMIGEAFWDQERIPSDLPHTNRLIRALGIGPTVEVSTGSEPVELNDLFLLCSDGVSGMMKPDVLLQQLMASQDLEQAGAALIQQALDGGGKDNASALLVRAVGG
jgi:protein phosphatase